MPPENETATRCALNETQVKQWLRSCLINSLRNAASLSDIHYLPPRWEAVLETALMVMEAVYYVPADESKAREAGLKVIDKSVDAFKREYTDKARTALNQMGALLRGYNDLDEPAEVRMLAAVKELLSRPDPTKK